MKISRLPLTAAGLALGGFFSLPTGVLAAGGAPSISTQPQSQSLLAGTNAIFSVVAGGQTPLFYRWSFNGTNLTDNAHISGATNATLTISNVVAGDAGNYRVGVTNNHGGIISSNATLIVLSPPSIMIQPTNQDALIGSTIIFYSGATSQPPVSYQWVKDGGVVVNGGRISGADTPTLTISNLQMSDIGGYQFEASNTNGTAASAPASLLIVPMVGWGVNYFGELNFPLTLTNVMALATGDANLSYLNLMIKADSSVFGWGSVIGTSNYDVTVPTGLSNAVAISAGYTHGLDLQSNGTVTGFGDNSAGQATPPEGLGGVVAVGAGWGWSLTLKNDGTVVAWGEDSYGEATPPPGLSNVVAISAGGIHGLALKNDGMVVGWGYNPFGEASSPAGLSNVVAISAGYYHNLALKSDGTVVGWGNNLHGESSPPAGLSNVVAIAASYTLSLALRNDGTVAAWGDNFYGQSTPPPGLSNVVAIAAGGEYGLALLQNPATRMPPSIWWQGLTNQIAPSGQTFLFTPSVSGSQPMSFQWYFNGLPLSGQTNSWLLLPSIQPSQAGNYQFTVSNTYGSVTSHVAAVIESPGILNQPVNQSSLAGGTVNFRATAAGSGTLFYQWYFNGSLLADNGRVSGSTTTNLIISNVQSNDVGSYELVVTNSYGFVTSQTATFTLLIPAAITASPVSQSILMTSNAAFSVSVAGTPPLSCQWYFKGALLTDGGRDSGSGTTNLIISDVQPGDGGPYQFVVTNNYGAATSAMATLTVLISASITGQPSNQASLINGNAGFTAAVTGTPPLTYQWYFNGMPLTDGVRVSGSTTTNLSISGVQTNDGGSYQLVVTNNYGTATSASAVLTVLVPAAIASQPTNRTVLSGSAATFTVTSIGTSPLNFLWYSNRAALANGGRFSGVTTPTFNISGALTNDSGAYQVIVTNNYGSVTSLVATLTVLAPVQITGHPASQAVLLGSNASFTVTAAGSVSGYQWLFNGAPLSDGNRINGSATPTLTVSNVQPGDAGGYVVVVTNPLSSATSRAASLTPQSILAPSTRYVALTCTNPLPPYLDWTTAATNIQDAINAAVTGDLVLVSNGLYSVGGRAVYGIATNRVTIDKAVTVQSFSGPVMTMIKGDYTAATHGGPSTRCAYLTNGAVLTGFTLTNGGTLFSTNIVFEASGGGVWCEPSGGVVSNCVLSGNVAARFGGGAFGGTLISCLLTNNNAGQGGGACSNTLLNCVLTKNSANNQGLNAGGGSYVCSLSNCLLVANVCIFNGGGGGAFGSTLTSCVLSNNTAGAGGAVCMGNIFNSMLSSNRAYIGGGSYSNLLFNCIVKNNYASGSGGGGYISGFINCTVVSNSSSAVGGGFWGGAATNSIIYFNGAGGNVQDTKAIVFCCTTIIGSVTNPPLFVDLAGGDFHLQSSSPCINSGNNAFVTFTNDFDGNPRIVGGTVDQGAYEFQSPSSTISYAYLQQYGLPTDGSADNLDSDGDGFSNWQEWRAGTNPTNAASLLQMVPVAATSMTSGAIVKWQSVLGVNYFVQRGNDLSTKPVFTTIQSNIPGAIGTTSYTDAKATNSGTYFYRVGVQ